MTDPGTERLFLAAPLTEETRARLAARLAAAPGGRLPGRPVAARNWHLTLRFLGDTAPARADALITAMNAAELQASFPVTFGRYGAFPRESHASVLWLGVEEGADRLAVLAEIAETAARAAAFPAESRPFRPHLTLSRIPRPLDLRPLLLELPSFRESMLVSEIVLYRSRLGGGPARYERVAGWALG